jgi:hypothetical protein
MAAKCSAIARSGSRCGSPVLPDSAYCWVHSPEAAEARRAASAKGGKARSNRARAKASLPEAMDAAELGGWLAALFKGVMTGRVEPRIGSAASSTARVMLQARELVEVEERLAALEEAAGLGDGRRSA